MIDDEINDLVVFRPNGGLFITEEGHSRLKREEDSMDIWLRVTLEIIARCPGIKPPNVIEIVGQLERACEGDMELSIRAIRKVNIQRVTIQ